MTAERGRDGGVGGQERANTAAARGSDIIRRRYVIGQLSYRERARLEMYFGEKHERELVLEKNGGDIGQKRVVVAEANRKGPHCYCRRRCTQGGRSNVD